MCTIFGPRPEIWGLRLLLSSSFFISRFSLSFIVFWPTYSLTDISILSNGAQVNHLKIHIHQSTSSSPCQSGFRRIFSSPFWREYIKGAHAHLPSVLQLPSVSNFAPGLPSFLLFCRSLFAPDKHTWAIICSMPLIFMFRSSSVLGFTLYLVWYLSTSIPTLITNVSIHRMVSAYLFGLLFSVRRFISLPSIINSFPMRFRFFITSIVKTAKTLYTFFYASSAPQGPLLNLSPSPPFTPSYIPH